MNRSEGGISAGTVIKGAGIVLGTIVGAEAAFNAGPIVKLLSELAPAPPSGSVAPKGSSEGAIPQGSQRVIVSSEPSISAAPKPAEAKPSAPAVPSAPPADTKPSAPASVAPSAEPKPAANPTNAELLKQNKYTDVLALPGWNSPEIKKQSDGSLIVSASNISELTVTNPNPVRQSQREFAIMTKMKSDSLRNSGSQATSAITLYNKDPNSGGPYITISHFPNKNLLVTYFDISQVDTSKRLSLLVSPQSNTKSESDELRIEVKGDEFNLLDGSSGKSLAINVNVPQGFFTSGSLFFGIKPTSDVQNGGAVETVNYLKIG